MTKACAANVNDKRSKYKDRILKVCLVLCSIAVGIFLLKNALIDGHTPLTTLHVFSRSQKSGSKNADADKEAHPPKRRGSAAIVGSTQQ